MRTLRTRCPASPKRTLIDTVAASVEQVRAVKVTNTTKNARDNSFLTLVGILSSRLATPTA